MNDETTKTVTVSYTYTSHDENDVNINLVEYRAWLGLEPDETIVYTKDDIADFLNSGPNVVQEITGFYRLDDFEIEGVTFDCG